MPARESNQLHDMHELMQQLETLHSAHDLDHLGMYGFPNIKMPEFLKSTKTKNKELAEKEMRQSFDTAWTAVPNKQIVLKGFVTAKLTVKNRTVIDKFLSPDDLKIADIEAHKTAFKVLIDNADEAKIQRMVEAFWTDESTRILLNAWVKDKQYQNESTGGT